MRVVLVAHGLAPFERTGVETHVSELASALGALEVEVLVFAPRPSKAPLLARAAPSARRPASSGAGAPSRGSAQLGEELPHLAERCEPRDGYRVHWLALDAEAAPRTASEQLDPPGVAEAFADFLERERPDLAHVHHLDKLGVGIIDELERRGIPIVFTAHDHWSICHRSTLMRPDLSRCTTPGRAEACARCDRAAAFLNTVPGLGDYHMGVLPDQLRPAERACLDDLLDGGSDAGESGGNGVLVTRRELGARRAEALGRIDRVLAPSRLVAEHAVAGGARPEAVIEMPYGVERAWLEAIPRPVFAPDRPLRFGYIGGLTKHKGVHVLLEAFAGRYSVCELVVHGGSNDEAYADLLADQARRSGARLAGDFDHRSLPAVLAEIDVLCVPSLWDENAPFVVREAFAAGRPVLASDVGALAQSVTDGVDGLLLPPGDVEAWRAAIDTLAAEPDRVRALAGGVLPPPALADTAETLRDLYAQLLDERRGSRGGGQPGPEGRGRRLAHLEELERRSAGLRDETLDALRARALHGVERLRDALLASGELGELYRSSFWPDAADGELQDRARDARREREWLRRLQDEGRRAREVAAEEAAWLRTLVADAEQERAWREHREVEHRRAIGVLEAEVSWLRRELEHRDGELAWLRKVARERGAELEWLRGVAADHAEARAYYRGLAGLAPEPEAAPGSAGEHPSENGGVTS